MDEFAGRFIWHELLTSDPAAAQPFYKSLMGWSTSRWEGGDQPYTMWMLDALPIGGVMALPDDARRMGAPPHWLSYVGVPDLDATVEKAQGLGARTLTGPMHIPSVGRFAVVADPQGAVFAVFQPEADPPPSAGQRQGAIVWHELCTGDYPAAFDFYQTLFGWEQGDVFDMSETGGGAYQIIKHGGQDIGGMFNKSAEMPGPPSWTIYINADNVDALAARAQELGGAVVVGPLDIPGGGRIVQITDPQGAFFAAHMAVPMDGG